MDSISSIVNKYRKIFYLASMACFMLLGLDSHIKQLALILVLVAVLLTPFKLRPLKQMDKGEFLVSGIILILYLMLDSQELNIMLIFNMGLAYYFIINSVDIIYTLFNKQNIGCKLESNSSKLSIIEIIIIAISSVGVMTFFTTSSPLYPINFWNDSNIYFSLGKGILNGLVPYRDVFEQKGPYLHFIYAIGALIFSKSFVGVYILEIVACFAFAVLTWKTVKLFYTPKKYSLILIPMGIILTYSCVPFHLGGSTEEFSLPILAALIYIALKAECKNDLPGTRDTIIIGVITGVMFLIKYTLCGLILGYLIFVIVRSIITKQIKNLPRLIGFFLIGFVAAILPALIYFGVNGALDDLYNTYIYDNIFLYTGEEHTSSIGRTLLVFATTINNSKYIFAGIILSVFTLSGLKRNYKIMYLLMFVFAFIGIYAPYTHMFYYCFVLTAITIPAFILISVLWDNFCSLISKYKFHPEVISIVLVAIVTALVFMDQNNMVLIGVKKDSLPQYIFAEEINKTPDAQILNYDIMDDGFHLATNTLPATKYYCFTNITEAMPEFTATQNEEISQGKFDYIITCSNEYNWNNYEIIMSSTLTNPDGVQITLNEDSITYYLYARK